ncbi:MAG: heme synthase [Polaromonas sp.]|jgi:cytochrome c oxidase assembly protein subunit 15|nr:heme synthase [Polaromonas sp.]
MSSTATALYDLSPVVRLMLMGVVIAIGPLAWVGLRSRHMPSARRLRLLTLLTLFLTFDLVVFGAFTRLTDSGLGCPDWPGCYGHASPIGAQSHIDQAQQALPSGPVTHSKAWIEMIHRYLATAVGVLILTLAVSTWLERRRTQLSPWWPAATLAWVCLQGAFGALTVTMKLFPAIVTLHLLGGMALLALLKIQALRYAQAPGEQAQAALPRSIRLLVLLTFAVLWLQIALGGWVSTNYAVLACTSFPSCQNSWWPAMDFSQGFTIWRELGSAGDGTNISFEALTAIHYLHRLVAYVLFAAALCLVICLRPHCTLRTQAHWLGGLILLQAATGLGNVLLGWPLAAAVLHTGGAAALVIVLTAIVFTTRSSWQPAHASKLGASRMPA